MKSEYGLDLRLSYIYNSRNRFHLWIRITSIGITTIYFFFPLGFKFCSVGARCHVPGVTIYAMTLMNIFSGYQEQSIIKATFPPSNIHYLNESSGPTTAYRVSYHYTVIYHMFNDFNKCLQWISGTIYYQSFLSAIQYSLSEWICWADHCV
jgi:hypothetical protein